MSPEKIMIRNASGELEPFDVAKFEHSLRHSHVSGLLIPKVTEHISKELEDGMTTHDIYKQAFAFLHKLERPAAARYSLRRALTTLGPTGFPFEKFVAELFKDMGYETLTDQIVPGFCVEHEVDVVAWNAEKLIMSEAKFHNELGLKTDLKVVLYVKARYEDLSKVTFSYGGKERKLNEGWLITNTKFTQSATRYAECQTMKIVGWNYPIDHGLKDMIEERGLYPITILSSLSDRDKKTLLDKGIILCKNLKKNPELLASIGLAPANIDTVIEEVTTILAPQETDAPLPLPNSSGVY